MATTAYERFTVPSSVSETAHTYYDLQPSEQETVDHKHIITASAQSMTQYSDSTNQVTLTFVGVPNLADPTKFRFDEERSRVEVFGGGKITYQSALLNENAAGGVKQLFGKLLSKQGAEYYRAFLVETHEYNASASRSDRHEVGCFRDHEQYSYNAATRTLTMDYVGVDNTPVGANIMAPFQVSFEGVETWTKAYSTTRSYYVSPGTGASIKVHVGKRITDDEIPDKCKILYDYSRTAPTKNGYAWADGSASSSTGNAYKFLRLSDVIDTLPTSTSFKLRFRTPFVDESGNDVALQYNPTVVTLDQNPFSIFRPAVTAYAVGDTIDLNDIATNCRSWLGAYLKYQDGATIHLGDVILADNASISAAMSITVDGTVMTNLRTLTIENLHTYENCSITLTIPTKYNGTLSFTYYPEIAQVLAFSTELHGVKTDFVYGETLSYGNNATATLYDNQGETITTGSIASFVSAGTLIPDQRMNQSVVWTDPVYLDGKEGQAIIRTTLQNANYYDYLIYVSYCDNFELSETSLGTVYVNANETTDISSLFATVTARYTYHHNTSELRETSVVELDNEDIAADYHTITTNVDLVNQKVAFTVSPEECPNQTLSAQASYNVVINRCVGLEITHAATGNTYYAGRDNVFVIPADLVVKKVYNNPALEAEELTEEEIANLQFRLAEGTLSTPLTELSSTVPPTQKTIYVTLTANGETLQGSYSIAGDYKPDPVTAIKFGKSFTFKLGNKLSTYRNSQDCILIAHYASGHVSNLTTEIFDDYTIVQKVGNDYLDYEKVIMASGETYYVKHNGNYFAVDYETGISITYTVPTGRISISGYQNTYINGVDPIDFSSIEAEITYDDTNSATTVVAPLDENNTASASSYALSCTGITDFDGTETFSISEEGNQFTRTITITAKNRFDANVTISATFDLNVVAISGLTITRLAIRGPRTKYKVGETFLNSSDSTVVDVYYTGSSFPISLVLRDVPSIFGTDPSQGTAFTVSNDSLSVTVRLLSDPTIYTTYIIQVERVASSSTINVHNIVALHVPNSTRTGIEELDAEPHFYRDEEGRTVKGGWYVLVDANATEIDTDGSRTLKPNFLLTAIKKYGYLEDLFDTTKSARVILFDDYVPPVLGESNIEVKFPCYVKGAADKINKCRIGKLFGNANAKNRLFLAGNPDLPNCDWHSGRVNSFNRQGEAVDANGDFTYFGDMDYCFYGQTDNAILGYDSVAVDKLIVIKSKSKIEPTNYFRTSSLIQAIDAGGNAVKGIDGSNLYMEAFPLATGNIGTGALNMKSIANLNGDTIFLSADNAICGLNIEGQVGDSQRIAYSRSRFIDPELRKLDLSDAVLWSDNSNAYLFTEEATYATHYETLGENYQYEWWKMDVKGVRCAIEIDGDTFFGCSNGSFYKFNKDNYYDCDKVFIDAGGALYVTLNTLFSDDKIVYAQEMNAEIEETAKYVFKMKPSSIRRSLFAKIATIGNEIGNGVDLLIDYETDTLQIVSEDSNRFQVVLDELGNPNGFYLNHRSSESSIEGEQGQAITEYFRRYSVVPTEDYENRYRLIDADGNPVALSRTITSGGRTYKSPLLVSADLCRVLDGEYEVYDLDKEDCSFRLRNNGRRIDIVRYGDQDLASQSFAAELHKHTPVYAFFIASPAVLGGLSYRKTIWSWTLSSYNEANDLQVCHATNDDHLKKMRTFSLRGLSFSDKIPIGFRLGELSFMTVDFGKEVAPRKYTYIRPLSVPFLSFGFKSERAANSILTATSIVYTIPMLGWGEK